jgi:Na+/H+ antiporter NhaD/arsenite permease-like protein
MDLFLQIFVIACFIVVIIALFREKTDFLTYSIAAMFAAVVATFWILPNHISIEDIILSIEWEVIFFLIALFTIVEVLEDKHIFNEVAFRITDKFHTNTRKFFWVICIISTLSAALIEDISVAIIFIPMIITTSDRLRINPAPILLGMTICINIASTLTPFGSAQNILIANVFQLNSLWFIINLGIYFVVTTFLTLILLDRFVLKKSLDDIWCIHCLELNEPTDIEHYKEHELIIMEEHIDKKIFNKNMIALMIFVVILFVIPDILFAGILGALIFVMVNPRKGEDGKKRPDISFYLSKVDFKLVFFFICLFILVFCMEVNGTLAFLEALVLEVSSENLFLMCIFVLIVTSVLSGFLDNIPVTVLFIPIIQVLVIDTGFAVTPLLIAFILGINLGGNIFPQGAACDMLTLEYSKKNHVEDLSYKRLLKVGGIFAILHIFLGIIYLGVIVQFY